jgi:hypothetical protein
MHGKLLGYITKKLDEHNNVSFDRQNSADHDNPNHNPNNHKLQIRVIDVIGVIRVIDVVGVIRVIDVIGVIRVIDVVGVIRVILG